MATLCNYTLKKRKKVHSSVLVAINLQRQKYKKNWKWKWNQHLFVSTCSFLHPVHIVDLINLDLVRLRYFPLRPVGAQTASRPFQGQGGVVGRTALVGTWEGAETWWRAALPPRSPPFHTQSWLLIRITVTTMSLRFTIVNILCDRPTKAGRNYEVQGKVFIALAFLLQIKIWKMWHFCIYPPFQLNM